MSNERPSSLGHAVALHARERPGFAARVRAAGDLLEAQLAAHGDRLVQVSSLGVEGQVLTDLAWRRGLAIPIATLDTGLLHGETLALIDETERRYGLSIEKHRPRGEAVVTFVARHGDDAMRRSVELRKACCAMRKLEPMQRLLEGRTAWVTGLRREQSAERATVDEVGRDANGRTKICPLADWSAADVWHYVRTFDVPYNALHDRFFTSIGCTPCTRATALGEDERAGRWWWENGARECGLHVAPA